MERVTSQKQVILDFLKSVKTHPSVEEVYTAAKNRMPKISRGTVYRNLKLMEQRGYIKELPGKIKRFDGNMQAHSHFICNRCGYIIDVFEHIDVPALKEAKVGTIENYQIYYYGLCTNCKTS